MKKIWALGILLGLLISCKTKPVNDANEKPIKTEQEAPKNEALNQESKQPCLPILPEKPLNFEGTDYNFTRIDTVYFIDDKMHISYQYSGCTEGNPVLAKLESGKGKKGTIINLSLKVKDAGLCEMLLKKTSCFALNKTAVVGNEFQIILNGQNTYFYRP